jgi:hypothetical protein
MHGGGRGSGGPSGARNGNFKHGRYTRETKELRDVVRKMARDAEASLAVALSAHGVKKKRYAQRRPRSEVEKMLAEILVSGQEARNPESVLQTIEQIMARAVRPK